MNRWIAAPRQPLRFTDEAVPPCEGEVLIGDRRTARWRKEDIGERWRFCTFPAVCEIDGKKYCKRHGGYVALLKLLGEPE